MRACVLALCLIGCPAAPGASQPAPSTSASATPSAPAASSSAPAAPEPAPAKEPSIGAREAQKILFLDDVPASAKACAGSDAEQIRCMLAIRYAGDAEALKEVGALYDEEGIVVGLEPPQKMDGGWRGMIDLVPELPVGRHRRHLRWLVPAYREYRTFFEALMGHVKADAPALYRYRPVRLRFFRSVGRTTPSAYASGWTIAYNVSGSLHTTADAVRETMFHETFHLNDSAHGRWSDRALSGLYEGILDKCTTGGRLSTPCLRPHAPNETMVRGGTYYAFQPGNGVWEYGAELAIRYYKEHRRILAGKKLEAPAFKCGPEPNAKAYQLLADEFFGGVDLVPPC